MTMDRRFLTSFIVVLAAAAASGCRDAPLSENVDANMAPFAIAGANQNVDYNGAPVTVKLDGSSSNDPDGKVVTYRWLSGNSTDGGIGRSGPDPEDVMSPSVTLESGLWVFTLWVIDDEGEVSEPSAVMIKVGNPPEVMACSDASLPAISTECRICLCGLNEDCRTATQACDQSCWDFYTCVQSNCADFVGGAMGPLADCVRANCTAFFMGVGKFMAIEQCINPPPCSEPCSASALGM